MNQDNKDKEQNNGKVAVDGYYGDGGIVGDDEELNLDFIN